MARSEETAFLLHQIGNGDARAIDLLLPLVYSELRRLARKLMKRERRGHTLEATALVHEAYLRLVQQSKVKWQGKTHFYRVASMAMHRLLKDHARSRGRLKRSPGKPRVTIDDSCGPGLQRELDMVELTDALASLAGIDARAAQVAEMRLLSGLTHEEIAAALQVDRRTVERDWRFARAKLISSLDAG